MVCTANEGIAKITAILIILKKYVVLVDACISSRNSCVPSATAKYRSHRKCLPGWNEHVRPLRQALFWQWLWLQCKRSNSGAVFDCMRHSRRLYHLAIRKIKRKVLEIRKNKIAENCENESAKLFWQSSRKPNPNCKGSSDTIIDILKIPSK